MDKLSTTRLEIANGLNSLPDLEAELRQKLSNPFRSPTLMTEVVSAFNKGLSIEETVQQLEGLPDQQRQLTHAFPPKFLREDIILVWEYLKTLELLKLISLYKQPLDRDGCLPVFHASTADRKESIRLNGILPNQSATGLSRAYSLSKRDYVFFYISESNAVDHAELIAEERNSSPIVVQGRLHPDLLTPDLDNHDPDDAYKLHSNNLLFTSPNDLIFLEC